MVATDLAVQPPPRPSRLRLGLSVSGLAAYSLVVAAATLSPTPLDQGYETSIARLLAVLHRNGVPPWFGYSKLEFTANIAMFVPLGFFICLALPAGLWWLVTLIIPVGSAIIELTQFFLLSERFASVMDVLANTAGGYLGAAFAVALRGLVAARDRKLIARALHGRLAR